VSPDIHVDNIPPVEEPLPPYKIEYARSNRSKCKVCKKTIDKGAVRIGIKIEGPFGEGFLWNHLACAAKRDFEQVEEAYAGDYTVEGVERPPLEELRALADKAEQKRKEKLTAPYVERAPSGRSKCHFCGEFVEQGAFRVVVLRSVEFYGQMRSGPIKVHPACVAATLAQADSATEIEGFADAVRRNSPLAKTDVEAALVEIGELGGS
jgi:hypothetical protein